MSHYVMDYENISYLYSMKTCNKCKVSQPESSFRPDPKRKSGLYAQCRSCYNIRMNEYYKKNKEKARNIAKKAYDKNKHKHVLRRKVYSWQKTYGISITQEVYQKMLMEQEYKCAICKTHDSELPKLLSVDHCHTTGKVRGLLCGNCNLGIGNFKDDTNRLLSAIKYLSK